MSFVSIHVSPMSRISVSIYIALNPGESTEARLNVKRCDSFSWLSLHFPPSFFLYKRLTFLLPTESSSPQARILPLVASIPTFLPLPHFPRNLFPLNLIPTVPRPSIFSSRYLPRSRIISMGSYSDGLEELRSIRKSESWR